MTVRVLVVEDHPVFRDGLVALLSSMPDFEVAGSVASGGEAVEITSAGGIDVVLMDLNLNGMPGVEATFTINAQPHPPPVLVVTMMDDDDTVIAAMRAGARGYILKGATGQDIAAAVRTVASGGALFGAGVATHVLSLAAGQRVQEDPFGLTERERDVLDLIAGGANNAAIARNLGLSLKTVQNYVSRILDKLQVSDRTQAALRARERHRR